MSHATHHIVKKRGHKENFDTKKLYATIYAACMALRMSDGQAELIADNVTKDVLEEIQMQHEVNASELHRLVVKNLHQYSVDAAHTYDTHRDIS